jgi:hypothetical protein
MTASENAAPADRAARRPVIIGYAPVPTAPATTTSATSCRPPRWSTAAPDDSLAEAAPFRGLGRAQLLQSARIEAELHGERQHDFKNVGQFLRGVCIVCRGHLGCLLHKLGAQKFPVLASVSDPDDQLAAVSADDLRDPVADQLFLVRHKSSSLTLALAKTRADG